MSSLRSAPPPRSASRSGSRTGSIPVVGAVVSLVGLFVVVAGTFLPWLTSGGVDRNSYAVLGIVRRLRFVDGGPTAAAISLWPLLGMVAMVPVVAGILRWRRTAAVTALLFGLLTGICAGLVLAVAGGHGAAGISLSHVGPVVTLAGAVLAVVGAVTILLVVRRSRRRELRRDSVPDVSAEPTNGPVRRTGHSAAFDGFPQR